MPDARILVYDIETTPNLGYTWGKWDQNVIQFHQEWHLLSFAYKWLGEKRVNVVALDDFAGYKRNLTNDIHVARELHALIDEANVTIAHNGDKFDMRKAQARFVVHGFDPPSPVRQIDTLKIARRHFMFNSNSLDDLGRVLGVGRKGKTGGFDTWLGCMAGDPAAWARMKKYNRQDVQLLEDVYLRLRPWIENHPHVGVLAGKPDSCPKCGVVGRLESKGLRRNRVTAVRRYQCRSCGGYCQARLAERNQPKPEFVG